MKAELDSSLHETSYQKTDVAFREKAVLAPLARMESFAEVEDEQEQVISPVACSCLVIVTALTLFHVYFTGTSVDKTFLRSL